jgi:hypothetical protein
MYSPKVHDITLAELTQQYGEETTLDVLAYLGKTEGTDNLFHCNHTLYRLVFDVEIDAVPSVIYL